MSKTNVQVILSGGGVEHPEHYNVKLDGNGFPYIIVQYTKYIINSTVFPREFFIDLGMTRCNVDEILGCQELGKILSNPELTLDKLRGADVFNII